MKKSYKKKRKIDKTLNTPSKLRGKFITFEGPEGSGKTTHIKLLAEFLKDNGCQVEILIEPGSTKIGKKIRRILLDPELHQMDPYCELFLYLAARIQLVNEKLKHLLRRDKTILCDRFNDATLTYQGYAAGIPLNFLIDLTEKRLFKNVMPDLTILLDIDAKLGLRRAEKNHPKDRQERKDISFHRKVREGYLDLARRNPNRIKVIPSNKPIEEVQNHIRGIVRGTFG